ncbi:FUSC family protein (plasmid) [Cereibacter azotoformans]|uniref:FUSC family protein n=1 Tax=Cereibacter azotoformans TaxID=43057 RepID=UPI003B20C5EE
MPPFSVPLLGGNGRQVLRVSLQTVGAVAATWAALSFGQSPHLSWAMIAALLTIDTSADASLRTALGRVVGVGIGTAVGFAAAGLPGQGVLLPLLVAAVVTNAIVALRPQLSYAAILAAVVAADPHPEAIDMLEQAAAILVGTLMGAAASFLVWPVFGRQRARAALRDAVDDCARLFELIERGVTEPGTEERQALHARFLSDLETVHSRIAETRFAPRLPGGSGLHEVASAVESLWHALVILDRVVRREVSEPGRERLGRLRPALERMRAEVGPYLQGVREAMDVGRPQPTDDRALIRRIEEARRETDALLDEARGPEGRWLHALGFALDEIGRSLRQLGGTVGPREGRGGAGRDGA